MGIPSIAPRASEGVPAGEYWVYPSPFWNLDFCGPAQNTRAYRHSQSAAITQIALGKRMAALPKWCWPERRDAL